MMGKVATFCPYCAAALESRICCELLGMRACWRCLRPIVVVEAAREPTVVELESIDADALNLLRKRALEYRESIRE